MIDDAAAVTAGARARDLNMPLDGCPYPARRARKYWRYGWRIRDAALARWARQADEVDSTLAKAASFLDRKPREPGRVAPSELIGLHFYAYGSIEPDKAYAWFQETMRLAREQFRAEVIA